MTIPDAWIMALLGGICIGLASIGLMIANGRIAGISGITFNALSSPRGNRWAVAFVLGLALGAFLFHFITGNAIPEFNVSLPMIIAGGFIVGVGTKIGSGCTSGHGICGLGRLSMRSMIATVTFMSLGFITVFIRLHGGL